MDSGFIPNNSQVSIVALHIIHLEGFIFYNVINHSNVFQLLPLPILNITWYSLELQFVQQLKN